MNLHEILLEKARKQSLGHFYIIESALPTDQAGEALIKFTHEFIRDYYQKIEGHKQSIANLMDHPDVYVLGNLNGEEAEKNDKAFKVEDAELFSRFFEFKPVQGKRKFAVITEGHRINNTVANKWLKLLEEPQGLSTIFILNPRKGELLPTIHSRAHHLRLAGKVEASDFTAWNELLDDGKKMTLSEFLDQYSRGDHPLAFWVNELIRWESEQLDRPLRKFALEKWLKNYQEMETFNQPSATKWTLFYSFLKEHGVSR